MPYIKQDRRDTCDRVVVEMDQVRVKADGDLNYILYKYCKYHVQPSYNNYKNFCGELRQCATEIERKLVAFYEEQKILENGNV
jgi:hypothetical protein